MFPYYPICLHPCRLKLGKLITPKTDVVSLTLEEFSVKDMTWLKPFKLGSRYKGKLRAGPSAMFYEVNALSGIQDWKYVVKSSRKTQFVKL